jgi:hypothetical protein
MLGLLGVDMHAAAEPGRDGMREQPNRSASLVAKTAPKMATPNAPPTEAEERRGRGGDTMSCGRTSFCTTSTSTCMTRPIPTPTTSM